MAEDTGRNSLGRERREIENWRKFQTSKTRITTKAVAVQMPRSPPLTLRALGQPTRQTYNAVALN
jgi:hypothetical protein